MQFEEKTIERKEIYQGPIFQVVTDQVELPDGKGQAQRDLIFHNGAVAVLPITDEGKTILVKQYRKAIERTSVEIPAGKLEKGENADPQAAALRELEEERPLWRFSTGNYPINRGGSDGKTFINR